MFIIQLRKKGLFFTTVSEYTLWINPNSLQNYLDFYKPQWQWKNKISFVMPEA